MKKSSIRIVTLREKCQIWSFFWSVFSCIRTEYKKIRSRKNSVFEHFKQCEYMVMEIKSSQWAAHYTWILHCRLLFSCDFPSVSLMSCINRVERVNQPHSSLSLLPTPKNLDTSLAIAVKAPVNIISGCSWFRCLW